MLTKELLTRVLSTAISSKPTNLDTVDVQSNKITGFVAVKYGKISFF